MSERYEIREKIAEGGLGSVFVAYDTKLGRDVALKRVLASGDDASEAAQDLLNEAKTLSSLQHPNIVTVYDVDQDDEGTYVVMELLKGETLDDVVERGALTDTDFKEVVRQTLEGMIAAQAAGLVHRDLKPSNIMVIWLPSGKFQCKILDFGLAKFGRKPSLQTEDQGEGIMGSIYFMAPEQFERAPLDMRTDMYSLGCVYYQALTTKYPFDGETGPAVMASHIDHRVVEPKKLRGDIPAWMSDWVMWLINRRMEDRPESAKLAWSNFQKCASSPPPSEQPLVQQPVQQTAAPAGRVTRPIGATRPVVRTGAVAPVTVRAGAPAVGGVRPPAKPIRRTVAKKSSSGVMFVAIIGLVSLLGIGAWYYFDQAGKAAVIDQNETLDGLMAIDPPVGDYETAEKLVKLIKRGDTRSDKAAYVLARLQGDGVESAILDAYPEIKRNDAKAHLLSALGRQGTVQAVETILAETRGRTPEIRQAALAALGSSANAEHLEAIIAVAPNLESSIERKALARALTSVSDRLKGARRTLPYLRALKTMEGDARDVMVGVLGSLGGGEAMGIMDKELQSSDASRQRAAARALAGWPTAEPLEKLVELAEDNSDAGIKTVALRGLIRIAALPGALPSAERVELLNRALPLCTEPKVKIDFLQSISEIPEAGAKTLAESLADDEKVGATAAKIAKLLDQRIGNVVSVAFSSPTELPLDKATLAGGYVELEEGGEVLGGWTDAGSTVSWDLRFEEPGEYEVVIAQNNEDPKENSYRVSLASARFYVQVAKSGSKNDFKDVTVGSTLIEKPGGYKLLIEPTLLESDHLMRVKSVTIRRR